MTFTPSKEQKTLLSKAIEDVNILTNAVAGSGKSTSMRLVCEALPDMKILYLVFNKNARFEAKASFPSNVTPHTGHSLAWFPYGCDYQHKMRRPKGKYVNVAGTAREVQKKYNVKDFAGITSSAVARLAINAVDWFQTSSMDEIPQKLVTRGEIDTAQRLAYTRAEKAAKKARVKCTAVKGSIINEYKLRKEVKRVADLLWRDRKNLKSSVIISPNTYLKLFQLSKPRLKYDLLILDEAQDTNDSVISIVKMQQEWMQTLIVGDDAQAIYAWNGATDALKKISGEKLLLSQSWRFGPRIANLATYVLNNGMKVLGYDKIDTQVGEVDTSKPYTHIFRTNIALIREGVREMRNGKKVKMEASIGPFLKMVDSLKALRKGDLAKVKHPDIIIYETWEELVEEAKEVNGEIGLLVRLLKQPDCEEILGLLRQYRAPSDYDILMITAHKSKGSEWEQVMLADDFYDVLDSEGDYRELPIPERNLLYVALTRAMLMLQPNEVLLEIVKERRRVVIKEETECYDTHTLNDMDSTTHDLLQAASGMLSSDEGLRSVDALTEQASYLPEVDLAALNGCVAEGRGSQLKVIRKEDIMFKTDAQIEGMFKGIIHGMTKNLERDYDLNDYIHEETV